MQALELFIFGGEFGNMDADHIEAAVRRQLPGRFGAMLPSPADRASAICSSDGKAAQ